MLEFCRPRLRPTLPDRAVHTGYRLLAHLAGLETLEDLSGLRGELVAEVPELAALTALNGERLVKTELAPVLAPVAPDSRETAFSAHLEALGLPSIL